MELKKLIIAIFVLIIQTQSAYCSHMYKEKEYQKMWCAAHNGKTEVTLNDKTRIDCLTNEYAIEFDFANKWAEAVGQSLYYALITNKKAGIVLILENYEHDYKYLERLQKISNMYNIKVWTIYPQSLCLLN